jgi:hypothetical protein
MDGLMKYIAGKKYRTDMGNNPVCTCLFADDDTVVMRWDGNRHVFHEKPEVFERNHYDEYKEPVVEKVTRNLIRYKNECSSILLMKPDWNPMKKDPYEFHGNVEITFTDGKLTDVRII